MTIIQANANPEKGLFLEMFVRDLSLEDCILDLVDNSIDSLIRSRGIDISETLLPLEENNGSNGKGIEPATVEIKFDDKSFVISDNCGGISVKEAIEEVFRFGHSPEAIVGKLGVYGIGLKRAIFKMGNHIIIESKTKDEGFKIDIDVPTWSKDPEWTLPLELTEGIGDNNGAGTSITINSYRLEVNERINSGTFESRLKEMIERTYCLFLNRYVFIILNEHRIEPKAIPIGYSDKANVAKEKFEENGVEVTLYTGLAARDSDGEWKAADAGWYVACNGRLIIAANKTELTGWGLGLPSYQPKYRGFIGLAFFYSENPLLLPWTTTKQGINQESLVFQRTRTRMAIVGRPVLTFLDKLYPSQEKEKEAQREVAEGIKPVDVRQLTNAPRAIFKTIVRPPEETRVTVQYIVKKSELNRVIKSLNRASWPATRIGRYTFDYYIKMECPE